MWLEHDQPCIREQNDAWNIQRSHFFLAQLRSWPCAESSCSIFKPLSRSERTGCPEKAWPQQPTEKKQTTEAALCKELCIKLLLLLLLWLSFYPSLIPFLSLSLNLKTKLRSVKKNKMWMMWIAGSFVSRLFSFVLSLFQAASIAYMWGFLSAMSPMWGASLNKKRARVMDVTRNHNSEREREQKRTSRTDCTHTQGCNYVNSFVSRPKALFCVV